MGVKLYFFIASSLAKTKAAAPSFIVEAFAAVTVPSFVKTGLRLGILSNLTLLNSSSSSTIVTLPFLSLISTGMISSLNKPSSVALADLLYDSIENSSCSSLEISYSSAVSSAKTPIGCWE